MFTGIIETTAHIDTITPKSGGVQVRIATGAWPAQEPLYLGQSIAVNGACLTVIAFDQGWFDVELSDETLRCTTFGQTQPNDEVNLERAMAAGGRFDGHVVSGHIDTTVSILAIEQAGLSQRWHIAQPKDMEHLICIKGSVTLDGISLTVNEVNDAEGSFAINLIPHTLQVTNLNQRNMGDSMNLETDLLARSLHRFASIQKTLIYS